MSLVSVNVAGHNFQIRTAIEEKYIHELAAEITRRMKTIKSAERGKDQDLKTIAMVAISLLDELNTVTKSLENTKENARQFAQKIIAKIDALLADNLS